MAELQLNSPPFLLFPRKTSDHLLRSLAEETAEFDLGTVLLESY